MLLSPQEILAATILIVDDQEPNIIILEHVLAEAGYSRVTSTLDALQACELHRTSAHDLILLDLLMPSMDGFQVCP